MLRLTLILWLMAGALLAGCSNDHMTSLSPRHATLVSVSPADGATGVRLDSRITLTFSTPVDREIVQRELHLISESAIADSVCPDSANWSHPDMEHCMADSAMMRHLDEAHATSGSISWNAAGTACTFQPSAWMLPTSGYMIHIGRGVTDMMGGTMQGMMSGHGAGMMSGDMMLHFATMDTSTGHDGHH